VAELAAQLASTPALIREAVDARLCQSTRSLDAPLRHGDGGGSETFTLLDELADPAIGPGGDPAREPGGEDRGEADRPSPELAWLHEQLASLDPRLRRLVEERVLVGCSWSELGRRFGMHPKMAERRCGVLLVQLRRAAAIWQQERRAVADQPPAEGHSSHPTAIASSAATRV
jgi:DNA-directed RNA polymerase specialized sigma24 family protein